MKLKELINKLICYGENYIILYMNSTVMFMGKDKILKDGMKTGGKYEIYNEFDIKDINITYDGVYIYCKKEGIDI